MLDGCFGFAARPVPFIGGAAEYREIDSSQLHHHVSSEDFS